ncbi:MAG TPA: NAD(P)-dependent methylenetetrahydromethanopterin dehydrogenase [Stellaceae bacterium]
MSTPRILHFLTPLPNVSPFDVNMAVDAGFVTASYTNITLKDVPALTQDAMFSRAPADAPKTCLFVGGRDAILALDMMDAAKGAMFPPFVVSIFADPSGAFTTAGAMVACVERRLEKLGARLAGAKVAVFGAKGVVGGVVGVIAAEAGAQVTLVTHDKSGVVEAKAAEFIKRFGKPFAVADGSTDAGRRAVLAQAEVVLVAARAGVQVLSAADLRYAQRLKVVADVNAVPPLGVEGLDVKADGAPIPGTSAVGIGALAIGNIKFRTQHALLKRISEANKAQRFDFRDAYRTALELVG